MSTNTLTPENVEEDTFEGLFDELTIPWDLNQYDVKVTEEQIKKFGEEVFLRWLHYHLKNRDVPGRRSAVPLACESMEQVVEYAPGRTVETSFFPEYPVAEDFVNGETDPEYIKESHQAKVQQLISQRSCGTCPIRDACRDLFIIQAPADGVFGVWGGHHEKTLKLVLNRYNKLRRAYLSTKTNDMLEPERQRYTEIARSLSFIG